MAQTQIKAKMLLDFLATPRISRQISEKFGFPEEDVARYLKKRKKIQVKDEESKEKHSYNLFVHRNSLQENIFVYVKEESDSLVIKPKIWIYQRHKKDPYMWIQFPDSLNFKKIVLAPISDAHYGCLAHMSKEFAEYLSWIKDTENVFGFLVGDAMENAHADSPPGAIFEQIIRPDKQIDDLQKLLAPLAHKILFGHPGNHEERGTKKTDIDPLKFGICKPLKIPYFREPAYIDILWKGYKFHIYCQHGGGGAITKGGKVNRALKPLNFSEHVHFNIMGHVHDANVVDAPRICRERKFDKDGNLVSFQLVQKKQYTLICPSFLEYFGSYGARVGYSPPNYGITGCEIYPNGNYNVTG